ncbi:efflux RND transporter periplasmic adaptor subunit [Salmonella enterica]|nr:efflux RND transporter periplasmic adaptor subunit [Salmonella enterica]
MSCRHLFRLTALASTFLISLSGCDNALSAKKATPAPITRVSSVIVSTQVMTITGTFSGRVEPLKVAQVRARIAGIVLHKNFEDGADVKKGQILLQIDPAPFKAALTRACAKLSSAEAQLNQSISNVKRYKPLVKINAISKQDFDNAISIQQAAQASRDAAAADVETARLNFDYATVTAPISGRISKAYVTEGALVGQDDSTLLATIQQINPVYVDFNAPANIVQQLRKSQAENTLSSSEKLSITVDGANHLHSGNLIFSDITVNENTGLVLLRGKFPNEDHVLLPGMYVRVKTPVSVDRKAILVPQRAVHRDTDGSAYVLVINNKSLVEKRKVETGEMDNSQWRITSGLSEGDRVITGGRASPGIKVIEASTAEKSANHDLHTSVTTPA